MPLPFPEWGPDEGAARADFEADCRSAADPRYVGDGVVLSKVLGRYYMYLDGSDGRIAHHLMFDGFWESWIALGLRGCIHPGDTVVDVGANHGYYSLLMAEAVGPGGAVIALEPQQKLFALLRRTVLANGLHGVIEALQVAASDTEGEGRMSIPFDFSGNGSLRKSYEFLEERVRLEDVRCAPIDSIVGDRPVHFIKIDVEGAEADVIAGMQATLRNNPLLQIGIELEAWQPGFLELLAQLQSAGFRPHLANYSGDLHEVPYRYLRASAFEPMVIFKRGHR
jgi:FkbM family methyltransferase